MLMLLPIILEEARAGHIKDQYEELQSRKKEWEKEEPDAPVWSWRWREWRLDEPTIWENQVTTLRHVPNYIKDYMPDHGREPDAPGRLRFHDRFALLTGESEPRQSAGARGEDEGR